MNTPEELERSAYLAGDVRTAAAFADCARLGLVCARLGLVETAANDACTRIDEAIGCYPAEDFAHAVLADLRVLAKRLRGANAEDLTEIIAVLEDLQTEVSGSTEYGIDELRKAQTEINEAAE